MNSTCTQGLEKPDFSRIIRSWFLLKPLQDVLKNLNGKPSFHMLEIHVARVLAESLVMVNDTLNEFAAVLLSLLFPSQMSIEWNNHMHPHRLHF